MLLHIGADAAIPLDRLKFILNARGMMPKTAAYIERAKQEHRFTACSGRAKSYIVAEERGRETVYASQLAASTLERRLRAEITHQYLSDAAVLTAFWKE